MINNLFDLKQRHSLYIILASLICFSLLGFIIYRKSSDMMIEQSKANAMGLSVIAANEIDGDVFATIRSENDPAYFDVLASITKYTDYNMLQYIYTMRLEDDVLTFVVDADPVSPAACGEEYQMLDDMRDAFEGRVSCDKTLTKDKWGSVFSAYAPIFNSNNEVVGIVGCDITTADIMARLHRLKIMIISFITVFAMLSLVLLIMISRDMMHRDPITEIANDDRIKYVAAKLKKKNKLKDYTGMLVNIKDFRYINQQMGFNRGDEFLKEYATYLSHLTERGEYVARTGNDNFLFLVKKGREESILKRISPLELKLENVKEYQTIRIYSRCGIYSIEENDNLSSVMNACTLAVNSTRKVESEDFAWYENTMTEQLVAEKKVLENFKEAVKNGEFKVYYQPKVNIDEKRLCGAEALVRWIRDGKMISPGEFIPVLEKEGKIIELDMYVFEQVCSDIKKWTDEGLQPVRDSSNFSKLHLKNPRLSEDVLEIINKYEVDSKYVEVELTESSGYLDFNSLEKFVEDMDKAGVYTSIDDFGTGYSSLSMLKDINVNVVKIDKSFFDRLDDGGRQSENLVGNVIHMIKDLDRIVICEGVETEKQIEFLKGTDCNIVQGFLFDRPLPREEFEERLRSPEYI